MDIGVIFSGVVRIEDSMLLSPEVNAIKARMMAVLVKDSEGFFDDPREAESLGITVRIACEFFIFLQESSGVPKFDEADYIAGTIRSGMDWFYSMAQTGQILTGLRLQNGFGPKLPSTFAELKLSYGSVFQQVLESTRSTKALGLLLSLVQMMLLFMTAYFPSFLSFSPEVVPG